MSNEPTLGDLCEIDVGPAFASESFSSEPTGPRLLRGDNVAPGRLRWDGAKFWSAALTSGYEKHELNEDDVILAMDRPWIEAGLKQAVVRSSDLPALLVQRVARLRARPGVEQGFLRWLIADTRFTAYIRAVSTGSTVPHISQTQIADYPVARLPDVGEQRAIAKTLRALDDKIESNRQLCGAVLHLCRTLLVQECSEFVRVRDVADLEKGLSYKGSGLVAMPNDGIPMANLANFGRDGWLKSTGLKYYNGDHKSRHIAKPGDLLVANTDLTQQRAILGRPALVPPGTDMLFTHHIYAVRFRVRPGLRLPLWASLLTAAFRERAEGFATGTTVAGLPRDALLDFTFGVPADCAVAEANDLMERSWVAERESATLAQMRDTLLPELLSGRLRVWDAEDLVEAAT